MKIANCFEKFTFCEPVLLLTLGNLHQQKGRIALSKLEPIQLELTQDGYFEFGVLFSTETFLEEVLMRSPKYLQYWGMDEDRFRETIHSFDLFEMPKIEFIDQFPMVSEAVSTHHPQAHSTEGIMEQLRSIGDEKG